LVGRHIPVFISLLIDEAPLAVEFDWGEAFGEGLCIDRLSCFAFDIFILTPRRGGLGVEKKGDD
jgi:hypothetical protein